MARVHQINISNGGVPKRPVVSAAIEERGIVGDEQADKVHHGSPDQALCLFSLEVIQGLQAEGHPIAPGSAGENVTIAGLDWSEVVPGTTMLIGPVRVEITGFATPCSKNAQWFSDGNFNRMHVNKHPAESRIYARVVEGGHLTTGDPVRLLG